MTTIAIIGDYKAGNLSHVATSDAVGHCSAALGLAVEHRWVGTEELARPEGTNQLAEFSGFWIAPGSPYKRVQSTEVGANSIMARFGLKLPCSVLPLSFWFSLFVDVRARGHN